MARNCRITSAECFLYYGNQSVPEVALTFDDGPNPYYTQQVLAVLQQYGIKATFFVLDDKSHSILLLSGKSMLLAMSLATIRGHILT